MNRLRRLAKIFLPPLVILGAWAFWWEPRGLRLREVTLPLPGWPAELSGLRIALLTDLHVGSPYNGLPRLREIVRRTNAAAPDMICLLGDYLKGRIVGHFVTPEEMAPVLGRLHAPLGVFAVLGNHDFWLDAPRVIQALRGAGIDVVEDSARRLDFHGTELWLGGISDFREGRHDIQGTLGQMTDSAPIILMTHNPDLFPKVPSRVSLVLAGHTHGGQVVFPFIGALVVPSIYGSRYLAGPIEEGGRHLFVATGTGMSYLPVRFLVPPEIPIVRLVSAPPPKQN